MHATSSCFAGFIYKSARSASLNGHDAGMLAFKDKRLAVFEELDKKETLDLAMVKEVRSDALGG